MTPPFSGAGATKPAGLSRERVEKLYRFEGPEGPLSLADLFDGRSQLVVYHFTVDPDWKKGLLPLAASIEPALAR